MIQHAQPDSPSQTLLQNLDRRIKSFRDVLRGELGPLERRSELIQGRRQALGFREATSLSSSRRAEPRSPSPEPHTRGNVVVEASDPVDPELVAAANDLADTHSEVVIRDDGKVIAHQPSGASIVFKEQDLVDQPEDESQEESGQESISARVPNMSGAAAARRDSGAE